MLTETHWPQNTQLLLVDDDTVFLTILKQSLQHQHLEARSVSTPQEAIEQMRLHGFSHALVDLNLDGQSGLNLVPALLAENPKCRIVVLTGYASITTAVEAMRLGAHDYLCKPASVEQILQALRSRSIAETASIEPMSEPEFEPMSVRRLEWEHIQKVLMENNGNISATAQALNMHRRTLQRKLQKHPVAQ